MTVRSIDKYLVHEWFKHKHYAQRSPSTISYTFGLFVDNTMVGVLCFGMPANGRCLLLCGESYKHNVIELQRVVVNDGMKKNTLSYFISSAYKLLPKPIILISYADPNNGHIGYIYQSLNFIYTGLAGFNKEYVEPSGKTRTDRYVKKHIIKSGFYDKNKTINEMWEDYGGTVVFKEKKHRYILFLGSKTDKKNMKKELKWNVSEYPKGKNTNYDSSYITTNQNTLF